MKGDTPVFSGEGLTVGTLIAFGVFPLFMIVAVARDIATMTISNRLSLLLAASFFPAALFGDFSFAQVGLHVAVGAAALALGFALFSAGWVGGGDAKFLAATALWMGWPDTMPFVMMVALAGGAFAVALIAARQFPLPQPLLRYDWVVRLHLKETGIPYAAALAAGALIVFPNTDIFAHLVKY